MIKYSIHLFVIYLFCCFLFSGCANIVPPVGGPRDSLPPKLVKASPSLNATNFQGNRINLQFDEFVELQNIYENVIIAPTQERFPQIDSRLRNITIKLKDSLKPATTYTIQFGNAIRDVNEGNVLNNFSYVFSTGNKLDSMILEGRVLLGENGKVDSTLIVMLHDNLNDSAVYKENPLYITRLDSKGYFKFEHLPVRKFKLYALKGAGGRKYTSNKMLFAFADDPVDTKLNTQPVKLYAFVAEPDTSKIIQNASSIKATDKKIRYQSNLENGKQSLLNDLILTFDKPLKNFDTTKVLLTDTSFIPIKGYDLILNEAKNKLLLQYAWPEARQFYLIIQKNAFVDTANNNQVKNDTIAFKTAAEKDYGSISIRFTGIDIPQNPILQIVQRENVVQSFQLSGNQFNIKLFPPGTYEMRILYDKNRNGKWDTGNFWLKKQPERVIAIDQSFNVRANWDNEFTINLPQ